MTTEDIRLAMPEDAEAIHALHTMSVRALCKDVYSSEVIDGWLSNRSPSGYRGIEKREMYVAERKGTIVGFSHVVPGEIVAIFVHPDYSQQGIGSSLVRHGIATAKANNNSIRIDATLNAQRFYERMGFIKTGEHVARRNDVEVLIVRMELKET